MFNRANLLKLLCSVIAGAILPLNASAQSTASTQRSPTLLQQLSSDTQTLYLHVRASIVRVQLPTPQWLEKLNARRDLLQKWGPQLSPQVRAQLLRQEKIIHDEEARRMGAMPASQPTTGPATRSAIVAASPAQPLVLMTTGMLIDDAGHAVVPLYVDPSVIGEARLRVMLGDGCVTTARFLGSDRKTNLTILQLADYPKQPVKLAPTRPADGTLTMVIGPDGSCRLVVWNNMHAENGLIVMPDESIAGFAFDGKFLCAAACKPLVDQVVATGAVHRAVLGVRVIEVGRDDVLRRQVANLGNRPAIAVLQVQPGSAAERGGLLPGDMILSVDKQPVGDGPTFAAVIAVRRGPTPLTVLRKGHLVQLTVELQPSPRE